MITAALLLSLAAAQISTSSSTPCALPEGATIVDAEELYCTEREAGIRWEGVAGKRALELGTCRASVVDRNRAIEELHVRLVESPPPAAEQAGPSVVRLLVLPPAGAALGAGAAVLGCRAVGCSSEVGAVVAAASSAALALVGVLLAL